MRFHIPMMMEEMMMMFFLILITYAKRKSKNSYSKKSRFRFACLPDDANHKQMWNHQIE